MEITESFWNTPKVFFDSSEEGVDIMVFRRCPECGRFIKVGRVLSNWLGSIKTRGWACAKHGEVDPWWERVEETR